MSDNGSGSAASNGAHLNVAIIGSGFSGIGMAIQLDKAGITDLTLFEKSDRLGGTWRDNTYPGSGCDVPSILYSYSFEQKTDWSRKFSDQDEILAYLEFCAEKYEVMPRIRFNTEISEARFDSGEGIWRLHTTEGDEFTANVFISGCGQLNRPYYPDIPGLDEFKGTTFHSARWRHDHDLTGERVAVIGNGASAVQLVPPTAEKVKQMYIFQRSANWIIEKPDGPFTEGQKKFFTRHPFVTKMYRWFIWALYESRWSAFAKKKSRAADGFTKMATKELDEHIIDPRLRENQTPDYSIGCKRILISNEYYDTLERDNVEVVTSHIEGVTEGEIVTEDGRTFPVDTIVCATGFQTSDFLAPIKIYGTSESSLNDAWKDGAEAYLGLTVGGFPNFFMLYGPNTNLGHNSIIFMMECQMNYIVKCIRTIVDRNLKYIDVRKDTMQAFNAEIQEKLKKSIWDGGCDSWYKNDSGKIINNWAYSTTQYWWRTRRPDFSEYHLESRDVPAELAPSSSP